MEAGRQADVEVTCQENKEKVEVEASKIGETGIAGLVDNKLQTISQYLALVEKKNTHGTLLKDSTITGFLVLFLGDDEPKVVQGSFQVIKSLAKHEENLTLLKNVDYLMDALKCVVKNTDIEESVRMDAKKIISMLKATPKKAPLQELSDSMRNITISSSTVDGPGQRPGEIKKPDLNASMSTLKRKHKGVETVLFLENESLLAEKSARQGITQCLISIRGFISVTYDTKKNQCIIRGKRTIPPEQFGRSIASLLNTNVYLVRRNDNKEESKTLIAGDGPIGQENLMLPAYPEEQENEEIDTSTAIASKDQLPKEDAGLLKTAKDFFKRSFYW